MGRSGSRQRPASSRSIAGQAKFASTSVFQPRLRIWIPIRYSSRKSVKITPESYGWSSPMDRFSPRPSPFRVYQHMAGDSNSLDRNYTSSIFEDSRGLLWIGSIKALQRLDPKTGKMAFYRTSGAPGELSTTWVISIAEDHSGRL